MSNLTDMNPDTQYRWYRCELAPRLVRCTLITTPYETFAPSDTQILFVPVPAVLPTILDTSIVTATVMADRKVIVHT